MPTQLTIKRILCDAYVKLDDCRAKLEEAQSDVNDLDIDGPEEADINDQLWSDIDDALAAIHEVDKLLADYVVVGQ